MESFALLVLKLWKGTLPNQKIYFVTLHYGVFHKILSIITELVCKCIFVQNAPMVYILIGIAILQEYILLEHVKK